MKEPDALSALSALSNETRLRVVRLLMRRAPEGMLAGELADTLDIAAPTLSNQLKILGAAGLVRPDRQGRHIRYTAALPAMAELMRYLADECCRGRPDLCAPLLLDAGGAAATERLRILFVCHRNSARSQIAEALLRERGGAQFEALSAGREPGDGVSPAVVERLETRGIDTATLEPKGWDAFCNDGSPPLTAVITVCDDTANGELPQWPGRPKSSHWSIPAPRDPASLDNAFRTLERRIDHLVALPFRAMPPGEQQQALDRIVLLDN
ncbi:MAG: metalloregulator ArsR/SmtB family transcription factor [Pseudomonadota bacterium]